MAAQFPDVEAPEFVIDDDTVAVAYAYLAANVKFTNPFYGNDEEFLFGDTPVTSFGIGRKHFRAPERLRQQVEVLYRTPFEEDEMWSPDSEFALDPCRDSEPSQIILARIERGATLAETLQALDEKIAGWRAPGYGDSLYESDVLLVPNLSWRIERRFREIENKLLLNENHTGRWLEHTLQVIDFRLDRTGAELRSKARISLAKSASPSPRYFLFDRPFLIVMRKRGAERPFFVMWVANAELLCKP